MAQAAIRSRAAENAHFDPTQAETVEAKAWNSLPIVAGAFMPSLGCGIALLSLAMCSVLDSMDQVVVARQASRISEHTHRSPAAHSPRLS